MKFLASNSTCHPRSSARPLRKHERLEYDEVMVSWLRALREGRKASASPLKIVAMSNISQPDFDALHARWGADFWDLFDQVFTSAAAGLREPSLGFYQHVLDVAAIDPQRAIFVDDSILNAILAGSMGIHSTLFERSASALAQEIKGLFHDPITRGNAFLLEHAQQHHSFTDCGITVFENYVQLLILEATANRFVFVPGSLTRLPLTGSLAAIVSL